MTVHSEQSHQTQSTSTDELSLNGNYRYSDFTPDSGEISPDILPNITVDSAHNLWQRMIETKKRLKLNGKKLAAIATISTTALLATACSQEATPTETPPATSTSAPDATNTPTPTPTETEAPKPEKIDFKVSPEDVASYLSESQETFMARPIEERVLVPLAFAENIQDFAEKWYSVSKNKGDILPSSISVDNTPQEILTITSYMRRIPYTVTDSAKNDAINTNYAYKMMGGNFLIGNESSKYHSYLDNIDEFADLGGRAPNARTLAVSGYIVMPRITKSSDLMTDQKGRPYRVISIVENSGDTGNITYYWVTATNGVGMWVQE